MAGGLSLRGVAPADRPRRRRRQAALALLVAVVLVVHGCATQWLADRMGGLGLAEPMPERIEVAYVSDMAVGPAPLAAPAAPAMPLPPRAPVAAPARAASAPEPAASRALPLLPPAVTQAVAPDPVAEPAPAASPDSATLPLPLSEPESTVTSAAPPVPEPAAVTEPVAAAQATPQVASPSAVPGDGAVPAFDWPVSTRLSYRLTGNVRGEVNGDAQVEWIRVDDRYQVHLDITVGLSFAPLMTRRMSSHGNITREGLSPRRYDQDTKVGFGAHQRVAVLFEPDAVVLANGQRRERWPGVQDTASQFIQLTYLFSTRPELLRAGNTLDVPLALPRNISRWAYDVIGEETVHSPIGAIATFHLKPRRAVVKGGDLSAEIWFAPSYRYLPVRIRIQQDAETFIDLVVARKPELAAP